LSPIISLQTPNIVNEFDNISKVTKYFSFIVRYKSRSVNETMRVATIHDVCYVKQSTLIPHELKPEVQDGTFTIPPVVMSHCLRFLCYHHLYNIVNRQQSLRPSWTSGFSS
jgi:hypothetical protein